MMARTTSAPKSVNAAVGLTDRRGVVRVSGRD
jgi:hypothetical protein